jgi:CheY-like chemotaxis protein
VGEHDRRVVSIVDDASLRRSLRNLLASVGFRVEIFESAEAFLESVHRENTGCVVLDLRIPGMSGLDLLRHLAATGSRIPVIILTAHGDHETRRRSLHAGAVAFLEKLSRAPPFWTLYGPPPSSACWHCSHPPFVAPPHDDRQERAVDHVRRGAARALLPRLRNWPHEGPEVPITGAASRGRRSSVYAFPGWPDRPSAWR